MPQKRKELKIEGSNLWYFVGLIATDGNLSMDGRHIDITSKDCKFLESIKQTLGIKNRIGIKYGHKHQKAFRIQIANKGFYEFLVSLGLTKNKSLTLGALNVPGLFFIDFLRGVIDGDGSVRRWLHPTNFREQWSLRIYSGSRVFIEWLAGTIEETLGSGGRIHLNNTQGTVYVLKFGKMAAARILDQCYYKGCVGMARKNILAEQCVNSHKGWTKSRTLLN